MTLADRADLRDLRTQQDARSPDGEEKSIARLVESLVAAFPAVPEPQIRDCVEHVRARFADARIRTYIPILVARQVRAALADHSPTADAARVG